MERNNRDEIVDEVRAARQAYAARFEFDIRRIVEDLKAKGIQASRATGEAAACACVCHRTQKTFMTSIFC